MAELRKASGTPQKTIFVKCERWCERSTQGKEGLDMTIDMKVFIVYYFCHLASIGKEQLLCNYKIMVL